MSRPLGHIVENWTAAPRPSDLQLTGHWAALQRLDVDRDAAQLWTVFQDAPWVWDYLFSEPPADFETFRSYMVENAVRDLQPCYVIQRCRDHMALGYACFWTVVPEMGSIEIGNLNLSPALQQTPIATEAFFLMINWAFQNGYRRVEWKCNALNAPSRKAAQRLGFSFEGVFRNHLVSKGRNRDTAWFAITDQDWPVMRQAYQLWLSAENFDGTGQQKTSLAGLTRPHLFQPDPAT